MVAAVSGCVVVLVPAALALGVFGAGSKPATVRAGGPVNITSLSAFDRSAAASDALPDGVDPALLQAVSDPASARLALADAKGERIYLARAAGDGVCLLLLGRGVSGRAGTSACYSLSRLADAGAFVMANWDGSRFTVAGIVPDGTQLVMMGGSGAQLGENAFLIESDTVSSLTLKSSAGDVRTVEVPTPAVSPPTVSGKPGQGSGLLTTHPPDTTTGP